MVHHGSEGASLACTRGISVDAWSGTVPRSQPSMRASRYDPPTKNVSHACEVANTITCARMEGCGADIAQTASIASADAPVTNTSPLDHDWFPTQSRVSKESFTESCQMPKVPSLSPVPLMSCRMPT